MATYLISDLHGNHEYIACQCLRFLMTELFLQWQEMGRGRIMDELCRLTVGEHLEDFTLYEEATISRKRS